MSKNLQPGYDKMGREVPDPKPVDLPIGFDKPEPLTSLIARLIRSEAAIMEQNRHDVDTFDEADDFDTGEGIDPTTPWEDRMDPEHPGVMARVREINAGAVADRPMEEKENARRLANEVRRRGSQRGSNKDKKPSVTTPTDENGGAGSSDGSGKE